MRRLVLILFVLAALGAALLPAAASATPPGRTTLYPLFKGTEAEALAIGPDGHLWFAGTRHGAQPADVVGWIAADGKVHEYFVPKVARRPGSVT